MKVDLVSLIIASIRESHVNTGDSSTKCDTLEKLQKIKVPTAVLDATIRRILFDLCDRHDECIDSLQRLLELVLDSSEQGLCASDLPLSMLEEIMDTQTISGCDKMFEFLERHRQRMTAKMGKGQTLLRLCNELLRRLSKTEDTVFCGRILIFLSLVFPLSERSAVNLRGEYNIDNVTTYEDFEVDAKATIVDTAAIDKAANEAPLDLVLLSNTIYTTFWSLQSYFNNPMQLLTAPVTLANFHSSLLVVVDAMESIERHIHKNESGNDIDTPQHIIHKSDTISEVRAYFTPKVLTSRKLLSLELADLSFRRHICIQILIVLDFLLGLTSASRETWDSVGLTINRSLQIAYVLPVADAEWVTQTRVKVSAVLGHGRSGARFLTLVESVLARDQDWLRWKCSGCASYVLPPIEDSRVLAAPSKVVSLTAAKRQYPHPVGNATLSKLWASAGGWSDAEIRDCPALPSPQSYLPVVEAIEAELVDAVQDDDVFRLEDRKASNSWRALRIARMADIISFTDQVAGGRLDKYLEHKQTISSDQAARDELLSEVDIAARLNLAKRPASEETPGTIEEKRMKMTTGQS